MISNKVVTKALGTLLAALCLSTAIASNAQAYDYKTQQMINNAIIYRQLQNRGGGNHLQHNWNQRQQNYQLERQTDALRSINRNLEGMRFDNNLHRRY